MGDELVIAGKSFTSRLMTGTGKHRSSADLQASIERSGTQIITVAIGRLNLEAVKPFGLSKSESDQCKNFWALGLLLWMFNRKL